MSGPYRDAVGFVPQLDGRPPPDASQTWALGHAEAVAGSAQSMRVGSGFYMLLAEACHVAQRHFWKAEAYFNQPSLRLNNLDTRKPYRVIHDPSLGEYEIVPE